MGTRIGIELSPVDCRIVEIEAANAGEARVRSLSVSPIGSGETRIQLARLRGREAAVVAWGLRGDHRQAIVGAGRYDAMRSEAIASLRAAGINTRGVLTDIAPAGPSDKKASRRPVVMALASKHDVASVLRPLTEAGIRVKSVVTPGAALGSVARLRRSRGAMSGVEAYVALEENATCIALVRQHVLVGARELQWGYVQENEPFGERVPREKVAARLADELVEFFSTAGVEPGSVSVVCVCGTLPELRSMTMALVERLDLEVAPLDSMFGFHAEQDETSDFRERGIELCLAWAVAADWNAPLNLLRDRQLRATAAVFARAAVVAGVGAGVTLGWGVQQAPWLQAAGRTTTATGVARAAARAEPVRVVSEPVRVAPEPIVPSRVLDTEIARPVGTRAIPEPTNKLIARKDAPPIMHEPVMLEEPGPASIPVAARPVEPVGVARTASPAIRRDRQEPVDTSGAALGSILFGPDRKLAMIDGRIVEAGDDLGGSMVVEIGPTSVTLRDRTGRLRKLSLGVKRQ